MKVLMTVDSVGGVWTYALELMRGLPQVEFVVLSMGAPLREEQAQEIGELSNVDLVATGWKLEWMDRPWTDVEQSGRWLRTAAESVRPDVVHLNGFSHAAIGFPAPTLVVAHSDVFSWWRAVHGTTPGAEWNDYHRRVEQGLRAADRVVAPTRSMLVQLHREYDFTTESLVIFNGDATPLVTRRQRRDKRVLAAGRMWDEAKNLKGLIAAAGRIEGELRIAGEGAEKSPAHVHMLGRIPRRELQQEMIAASVFASPALYEPFGLTVLEAARSGCALVLSDIAPFRELWDDAASFVDPRDPTMLGDRINELLGDEVRCRALARAAQERSIRYSVESFVGGYERLYSELAASGRPDQDVEPNAIAQAGA